MSARSRDFFQQMARTTELSGKPIRVRLLEGWRKVITVTVILLNRSALILHHVGRFFALGANSLVDATLCEAARLKHIGNMDFVHPIYPFGLDAGLKGYRDAVYHDLAV